LQIVLLIKRFASVLSRAFYCYSAMNVLVEHQCPQCGAPVILKETDRIFACGYCRVKSYLSAEDYFCYMLPNRSDGSRPLVFFPYWRFRGMLFSCFHDEIDQRFIDFSYRAKHAPQFPPSVGLRSQTLKLKFVSRETTGRFLYPTLSIAELMNIFARRFNPCLSQPVLYQAVVGETFSLIYSPFYIASDTGEQCRGQLFDAVLNKPVSDLTLEDADISLYPGGAPNRQVRLIPTLCPECGWDMDAERDALVLICKNCSSVWKSRGNGFEKLPVAHKPETGDNIIYLPFWKIRAEVSGLTLDSYADMVSIANLPRMFQKSQLSERFCFWTAAFKVRPRIFLTLCRNMTLSQPRKELIHSPPAGRCFPVTLPAEEAAQSLKIILAGFMKPRKTLFSRLGEIKVAPNDFLLVYVPFQESAHEFIQPEFLMAVSKKMLELTGNQGM